MKVLLGDITRIKDVDVIVNSANGIGVMGAGVAGALSRSGGKLLIDAAKKRYLDNKKPFEPGEVYDTDAGLLKRRYCWKIFHAVVMKFPGSYTKVEFVEQALEKSIEKAINEKYKSIAIPGMGIGIGGLDKEVVARKMARIIQSYNNKIDITIVDIDEDFIKAFKNSLIIDFEEGTLGQSTDE